MKVVVVKATADGSVDLDDLRGQDREPPRPAGRDHGHLPLDPRGVRGGHHRPLRAGARGRRAGLRRRRQPQRAARAGPAGKVRRGRQPPQPAQDLLHPARRRRPGRRPRRRSGRTWRRSCPVTRCSRPGPATGIGPISAAPYGSAGILPISYAYIAMMGADGLTAGHRARAAGGELRRRAAGAITSRCSTPAANGRVAHECILDLRPLTKASGITRRRRGQAADRLRLPRPDHELPGGRHA